MKLKQIAVLSLVGSLFAVNTVFAEIPHGTIVIGNKAYDLNYANNYANRDEIQQAIIDSKNVIYVKMFDGSWINNNTGEDIQSSSIPAITYKDANGKVCNYKASDGDIDSSSSFKITIVE